MEWLIAILNQIGPIIAAINAALVAIIAVCLLIPGDFPEKQLQSIVDFLSKFSKK